MTLLVVLGNTPDLAWQELITLYPSSVHVSPHVAMIENATISPGEIIKTLGGTVKVGELITKADRIDATVLASALKGAKEDVFGVSVVDSDQNISSTILGEVKQLVAKETPLKRYVTGRDGQLSSVVLEKQHVHELIIFPLNKGFGIGHTLALQEFEQWTLRDRGRPHADAKAGMLPPKIARMMVNIAPRDKEPRTLLDPFCGMGTILGEAMLVGWNVIGSDQSADATRKTEANLGWLISKYPSLDSKKKKLLTADATHISEKLEKDSIDAIVTEPFMGNPDIGAHTDNSSQKIKNVITGLEKLYIGALKDWHKILKTNAKVVITLPLFAIGGKNYFVKKVIDSCETLGYTVVVGPIEYSRASATVRRQIYVFKKK